MKISTVTLTMTKELKGVSVVGLCLNRGELIYAIDR